jgi:sulfotransferase family protein
MPPPAPDTPAPNTLQRESVTIRAMLAGAPKAGTTSLYRYAVQHPELIGHTQRELSYFFSDVEYQHGYDAATTKYFAELTAEQTVRLAKHVFTMYSPGAIARLKEHNPHIHVFALLRDPVRRAYSSFWYAKRRGWDTAKTFEQAIKWEADQTIDDDWLNNRDRMHLHVGIYLPHIKRLLDTFGKDHVHIFLTDDLATDAAKLCRSIYQATGVDPTFTPDLTKEHNTASAARSEPAARALAGVLKSKNPIKRAIRKLIPHSLARRTRHALITLNEKPFTPPPMNEDTRRKLIDHFAPHNEQLAQLIGRDLRVWNRGTGGSQA